jgi:hypothetical protein
MSNNITKESNESSMTTLSSSGNTNLLLNENESSNIRSTNNINVLLRLRLQPSLQTPIHRSLFQLSRPSRDD